LFCPQCKLEYRPGFTHCNDCDVDLVAELPKAVATQEVGVHDLRSPSILRQGVSAAEAVIVREALNAAGIRFNTRRAAAEIVADGSPAYEFWVDIQDRAQAQSVLAAALEADAANSSASLQLVWGGADRGMFDRLCSTLDEEEIPYFKYEPLEVRLGESFGRNPLEISVNDADYAAAAAILAQVSRDSVAAASTSDSRNTAAVEDSKPSAEDDAGGEDTDEVSAVDDNIDDDELTAEAWSGNTPDQANVLKLCLREVGIASRIAKSASGVQLLVAANHLTRAREIVREVVEAAPSE
jgi:hypothetical protein